MQKSSFFNSINGDRKYNASDIAAYFSSFIGNGVYPNPTTCLQVSAAAGMNISIATGKAWINGYYYENTDALNMAISASDGVLKRIDRIVVRLDHVNRQIILAVTKGAPASNPIAPELTRDADIYEIALADILINNGDISVSQAQITDLRMDANLCGIVSGVVDQIDTTGLFAQYDAEFNNWFASVQSTLDGDTAGNLLNKINELAGDGRTNESVKGIADALATHIVDYTLQVPFGGITANVGNSYSIATPEITALTAGMAIAIKINANSTGASTLDWNGKGAKPIKKANGSDVTNLKANGIYTLRYDGANFILQGEGGDDNLIPENIKYGITIDGIVGTHNGVEYFVAGDDEIFNRNLSITKSTTGGLAKVLQIQVKKSGKIRVSFNIASGDSSNYCTGQVWINGIAKGILRQTYSTGGALFTEDFDVNADDLVQIYIYKNSSTNVTLKQFTLKSLFSSPLIAGYTTY